MTDPYLQPNGTLKNKLGITDTAKLDLVEARLTGQRLSILAEAGPKGSFTYERLKETHRFVFQDIYAWAGKERITDLYKAAEVGGPQNRFTPVQDITSEAERVFSRLTKADTLKNLDPPTFAKRAADLFADINQLHPFREGNGRTQRAFVSALAREAGHELAFDVVSRERMLEASIRASQGHKDMMRRLFNEISDPQRVEPLREAVRFLTDQKFDWNERYVATTEPGRLYKGTFVGQNGTHFMMHDGSNILIGKVTDLSPLPQSGETVQFRTNSDGRDRNRGLER